MHDGNSLGASQYSSDNTNGGSDNSNNSATAAVLLAFFMITMIALFAYGYSRWSVKKREGLYRVVVQTEQKADVDLESGRALYEEDEEDDEDDGEEVEI